MRHPVLLCLLATLLPVLTACEQTDTAARFRERQRKYDPLYLWSVQVVSPQKSAPITICADTFLREGFVRPLPNENGKQCALHEPPTVKGDQIRMYCTLNDRDYVVRATVKGDPKTAFDLYYAISTGETSMRQVRRFRRLGACPAGWDIGDNTDRAGKLRKNALH